MKSGMESKMSLPVVIGVDIGKEVFHLVGFAADGKVSVDNGPRNLCHSGIKHTLLADRGHRRGEVAGIGRISCCKDTS